LPMRRSSIGAQPELSGGNELVTGDVVITRLIASACSRAARKSSRSRSSCAVALRV
jgi:hypothetical protein